MQYALCVPAGRHDAREAAQAHPIHDPVRRQGVPRGGATDEQGEATRHRHRPAQRCTLLPHHDRHAHHQHHRQLAELGGEGIFRIINEGQLFSFAIYMHQFSSKPNNLKYI